MKVELLFEVMVFKGMVFGMEVIGCNECVAVEAVDSRIGASAVGAAGVLVFEMLDCGESGLVMFWDGSGGLAGSAGSAFKFRAAPKPYKNRCFRNLFSENGFPTPSIPGVGPKPQK